MTIAFDTETALIRPGKLAPELVCLTWKTPVDAGIAHHNEWARPLLENFLTGGAVLVGQNVAFDAAVVAARFPDLLPLIFEAYNNDHITDTKIRQQLLDVAAGCYRGRMGDDNRWVKYGYSLDDLARRHFNRKLDKDTWRLRYGEFLDVPLDQWPEGARTYPLVDAEVTYDVWAIQEPHADFLQDQYRQARAAFALHLSSAWGIRTNAAGVQDFLARVREEHEDIRDLLIQSGLVRSNGSRNTKAAKAAMLEACAARGIQHVVTDSGDVSLAKEACELVDDDPVMHAYSEYQTLSKVLSNDGPMLMSGTQFPIHTHYDLAETGRTTSSNPNIQNLRRKVGIREAFVPRPGKVFAQADYEGLELCTLAQCCIELVGYSKLGDAINAGRDAHMELGATILGIPVEEALRRGKKDKEVANARQSAKIANFGFPVGMGPDALVHFAKKTYNTVITPEVARSLKQQWLTQWPEMQDYFRHVNGLMDADNLAFVEQLYVKRFRGRTPYTRACSTYSQGLGGDAAKQAMWELTEACYNQPDSPLFGSRIVAFVHDEAILEVEKSEKAHEIAVELGRVMIHGAKKYLKDVNIRIEPLLMDAWTKEAIPCYDKNGRLVSWNKDAEKAMKDNGWSASRAIDAKNA